MQAIIQPVELHDLLLNVLAAAGVILTGAAYAGCYAWARLRRRPGLQGWAYVAYALLVICVWTLGETAHFEGYWRALTTLMLIGYFAAPRAVYRLCSGTHGSARPPRPSSTTEENPP